HHRRSEAGLEEAGNGEERATPQPCSETVPTSPIVGGFLSAHNAELAEDLADAPLGSVQANAECRGDLRIALTARKKPQDLLLPRRPSVLSVQRCSMC